MSYFITGTDTGVGKTHVTALLLRAFNESGRSALGYKPLACGDRLDAEALRLAGCQPSLKLEEINPVFYRVPASPMAAAMIENRVPDMAAIRDGFDALRKKSEIVLVEGAGGWLVPITATYSMADLAADFALPVLVVESHAADRARHRIRSITLCRHHSQSSR
jgi:dethiobiotin synthetase